MSKSAAKKSFEEALEELENVADELASGRLSIDEAIKKYEQAVRTYKLCQAMLDKASERIKILMEENGRLKTSEEETVERFGAEQPVTDEDPAT